MMRSNYAAATDVKEKLLELAAMELGGDAKDYELKNGSVVSTSDSSKSLSYAAAAKKAIELGGKFDGHELAEDLNPLTAGAATAVAGTGLVGASKDRLERVGTVPALSTALMEIELDAETGKIQILDYICVADCGTVIHPDSLATQIRGGAVMGFGFACAERAVYDPKLGLPGARGFYQAKPFTYLDVPPDLQWGAVDKPDPQNPVGTKGVGEPVYGSGAAALVSAISDALGGHTFKRSPITPDMIVLQLAGLPQSNKPLQANTQ
jgi:CO/xanthine dehydrogenase Mo-binding subunit